MKTKLNIVNTKSTYELNLTKDERDQERKLQESYKYTFPTISTIYMVDSNGKETKCKYRIKFIVKGKGYRSATWDRPAMSLETALKIASFDDIDTNHSYVARKIYLASNITYKSDIPIDGYEWVSPNNNITRIK
jgi:hypothetical protein